MKTLAILGSGHIGSFVYENLKNNSAFQVNVYDLKNGYDLESDNVLEEITKNHDGVLASTPYFLNKKIATYCDKNHCDYFDLTESVDVTNYVKTLSNASFVTQCGLAPGMVSIIANNMASQFEYVKNIKIRVGALPKSASNNLGYYKTWNTEGLINEYIHPCPAIVNGKASLLEPVSGIENVSFDGVLLEAANTSGGLGSLADTWENRAENVNYKTLRYPGHWKLIQFLKDDMGLKNNFQTYVKLFNDNIPNTVEDCIYILIDVDGYINNKYEIKQYSKYIINRRKCTAIQMSTGYGAMTVLDSWAKNKINKKGWVKQEELDFNSIWNSQYSECYK